MCVLYSLYLPHQHLYIIILPSSAAVSVPPVCAGRLSAELPGCGSAPVFPGTSSRGLPESSAAAAPADGRMTGCTDRQIGRQIDRQTDRQTERGRTHI